MALKSALILELHKANPDWRRNDIARAAGCSGFYVSMVLGQHGLFVRKQSHNLKVKGEKPCVVCGINFPFWSANQKCCSLTCRSAHREDQRKTWRSQSPEAKRKTPEARKRWQLNNPEKYREQNRLKQRRRKARYPEKERERLRKQYQRRAAILQAVRELDLV